MRRRPPRLPGDGSGRRVLRRLEERPFKACIQLTYLDAELFFEARHDAVRLGLRARQGRRRGRNDEARAGRSAPEGPMTIA
ncbi:hypothetical protein CEP68_16960 [Brevundimonas vesicularis]|uniref:Uncharacterized protein n=1 Tax=Brevundimonas vesicularis TaxID=41276 RepID=A0A2P1CN88_BREVE|nr:hypothetical protein CEP68_16960 [Brevundimonas vesicularis]